MALLHTMCQHIHRNHLAFVESIKHKIPQAMLQEFQNDLPAYLQFLSNTVKLISLTGYQDQEHNDLFPHLLLQLRSTTIPMFQQSVLKWQREYFENTLALTLSSLISKADKECQILWHAGQWVETIDPLVAAMQALLQQTKSKSGDLLQSLAANFSSLAHRQWEITRAVRPPSRGKNPMDTPGWLLKPPRYQGQIKHFNGRDCISAPNAGVMVDGCALIQIRPTPIPDVMDRHLTTSGGLGALHRTVSTLIGRPPHMILTRHLLATSPCHPCLLHDIAVGHVFLVARGHAHPTHQGIPQNIILHGHTFLGICRHRQLQCLSSRF